MKRTRLFLIPFVAVVAVLLLHAAAPAQSFRIVGGRVPEVGKEALDFSLPATDGKEVTLSDFKGKVILLSFWSCYTDKCFTSVNIIRDLLEEFHERGLVAPTVCSEIPEALARNGYEELLKRCGLGQAVMIDVDRDIKRTYKVRKLPGSYLIGPDFMIHEIVKGTARLREPGFRESIATLLKQAAPAPPAESE